MTISKTSRLKVACTVDVPVANLGGDAGDDGVYVVSDVDAGVVGIVTLARCRWVFAVGH